MTIFIDPWPHAKTGKVSKKKSVHFSSQRTNWKTPKALYQGLNAEFDFDFDPCPVKPDFDGLTVEWKNCNYCNPPYGRVIGKWIKKAYEESLKGKTCVLLVPSRTDTKWWHEYIMKAEEIRFIKGRLHFDDHKNSAPFPSAIVVFRGENSVTKKDFLKILNDNPTVVWNIGLMRPLNSFEFAPHKNVVLKDDENCVTYELQRLRYIAHDDMEVERLRFDKIKNKYEKWLNQWKETKEVTKKL